MHCEVEKIGVDPISISPDNCVPLIKHHLDNRLQTFDNYFREGVKKQVLDGHVLNKREEGRTPEGAIKKMTFDRYHRYLQNYMFLRLPLHRRLFEIASPNIPETHLTPKVMRTLI